MEYIWPDSEIISSEQKAALQTTILIDVYDKTYPLGDVKKAADQIKDWIQRVLFWGSSTLEIIEWKWWTLALIQDFSKWKKTVEMCRAGSNFNQGGWVMAVRRLINYFLESELNQIYATPRNCDSRYNIEGKEIPWGRAIYKIFCRIPEMQFWGIAPWYIMPGEALELLDLRVLTKKDLIREKIAQGTPLHIHSVQNRTIFWEIIQNNYWMRCSFDLSAPNWVIDNFIFSAKYNSNPNLRKYNYTMFEMSAEWSVKLSNLTNYSLEIWSWVDLIKLDLFDPSNQIVQEYIEQLGFKMVSLFPEEDKLMGYWFKSANHNYALPIYVSNMETSENKALKYQRAIIDSIIH